MKKILLIAIFMVTFITSAQIKLSGIVKDSIGAPLEMANVIAIDTVAKRISSFGFTDANGNFKLDLQKNKVYNIKISYVGFKEISEFIKSKSENITKDYIMLEDNMLDGINIVSKMPVTIKGDTIIYNADSFKNGSERKLKDVLEKLPGVEINDQGQIEVEGKAVEKIMVDGKEFFSGDTKLATENIPSNAVDKIQVLRNYSNVSQLSGVQNNQDRVAINIKLKEGKKNFWFGDVSFGGGQSQDETLYLFQPKLFYYTPKYTINIIGDVNNLGDVVISRRDARSFGGSFQSQSPSNGTNINIADAGIGFLNAGARNANRIESKLSALNFSYSPNKKLDLSGFLIWSGNSNGQRNISDIDYVDPNIPDEFRDTKTDQTSNTGLFRFSSIYKKDFNNQLNYNVAGRFSNEFSNQSIESRVLSDIVQDENATPYTINQDFSYFYTASEKSIFALEVKHLLQDEDPFYVASLENDPNNNDDADNDGFDDAAENLGLDRTNMFYTLEQDRKVKTNQLDAKLDYYYILNQKSNLNFVTGTILSSQNFNSRFFQILDNGAELDPNPTNITGIENPEITNDTQYNFTDIYAGLRYRLKAGIFTFTPGFTVHSYNSNNTQYGLETFTDEFFKFLPEFETIAQFKRSESLTFTYRQEVNFTDVNQIARGIVANNYDSFFAGNPELINSSFHNVSLRYSSFNLFNNSNVFSRINYRRTIDQVNRNTNFAPGSVVASSTSINSPLDNESFSASLFAGKRIGKIQTRLGGSYNYNKSYQFINEDENTNINTGYGFNTRIGTNFTKAPNVTLSYNVNFSNQENSSRAQVFKSVNHRPSINFDAYIWNSVTLTSDFSFNEQRQNGVTTNTFSIWNAKLAYRKDRDAKLEYEVVGNNLLATGSEAAVSQSVFAFTLNERFILPRFISFRIRYQL
ncbi:carboxypeptidase-like regulatory domain-containing protein [Polaribacter litorisediminis]|uniref:carboxypeptidase-like regulatory domain-containing protein n=1 Tax=Polaribacter litorisediminis TaxID=1908341 RepID=UPI001CBA9FF4|nr:carboxypeptidase-like regulatory domain-containing protein [Polaribacter litorisediminis]UAM98400.1 carboxypeptidase-like regulatory domain-containing protein [Polaribacter litorisediminis]